MNYDELQAKFDGLDEEAQETVEGLASQFIADWREIHKDEPTEDVILTAKSMAVGRYLRETVVA